MRIWFALAMLVGACLGSAQPLHAQSVIGTWQATFENQRKVAKITKLPDGRLHGEFYNLGFELGGTRNGNPMTVAAKGRHVHFAFDEEDVAFEGELSADGNTLAGRTVGGNQPITFNRATPKTAWLIDPSLHTALFVPVKEGVRLEVLDWGGKGPPLIFLAGAGDTAHEFDDFAPKFTAKHHVYGITRRGFGMSSKPEPNGENYDADRLGDDVLAVIDALKLDRPVIAGHSFGGEELSSIGTRHPERVSGLIYLEAGYPYAFYNPNSSSLEVEISALHRDMVEILSASQSRAKVLDQEMQATLPHLQKDLQSYLAELDVYRADGPPPKQTLRIKVYNAMFGNERKYSGIKPPVLAIFASPKACDRNCDTPIEKAGQVSIAAQADAFQAGTPQARVVRIAGARHDVFRSNEAQVIQEMNVFIDGLH